MTQKFYDEYLAAMVAPYVSKGVFVKNTGSLYNAADAAGVADAAFLSEEYTANATDDVYIVQLEKNVPQRIRMFVWLEGQDADCVNSAEESSFAVRIELAGSHELPETGNNAAQGMVQEDILPENESVQQDDSVSQEGGSTTVQSGTEEPSSDAGEESGAVEEPQSDTLNETEVEHEEQNE